MSNYTIYHNPRCSKSRQTLALLRENDIEPEIVLYLEDIPSREDLVTVLRKLKMSARDILRKGEEAYKSEGLSDSSLSEEKLISTMIEFPKLIERPIVIKGDKAVLGRPPENALSLI